MINKNKRFIKDNIILLIGIFLNGTFSYIFHFIMGRSLGPVEYGELNTIIAINYIIVVFFYSIQTSITQFTAKYKSKKEYGKINYLIKHASRRLLKYSLIVSLLFSLTIPFLGRFLNLGSSYTLLWLIPMIIISLIYPITRGALQGLQKFKGLSLSYIAEGAIKVILGIFLVLIGLRINGAVAAIILGLVLTYPLTLKALKKLFKTKTKKINTKEIYSYSFPVFFTILILTLMYSLDILLIKHFFPAIEAGYYAALAILGKVIFFSVTPLAQVMFPKVTEARENKKNYRSILYKTLGISLLITIPILLVYFFIPNLAVGILFGSQYAPIVPLLKYMGLMIAFLSVSYILCYYNLSLNKKSFIWIILVFLILEIGCISLFHNSLFEIIRNLTIIMFLFLLSMILYSLKKK